jgi:hypothetical protein
VIRQIGSRLQRIEHCGPGGSVTRRADLGQRQTRGELFTGDSSSVMAMSRLAATGYGPEALDVDFAFAEICLEFTYHTQTVGSLAYLAPEYELGPSAQSSFEVTLKVAGMSFGRPRYRHQRSQL